MSGMVCHFHADEWSPGRRLQDGTFQHECDRTSGHPTEGPWSWLEVPEPPSNGLSGLAEELNLAHELPAALASLGSGWFEYGLVEQAYAVNDPGGFARMTEQWGHTALAPRQYTASSYIAGTLGRLSKAGVIAYHPGVGTGRWSYNSDISWWSVLPAGSWSGRTSWKDRLGDAPDNDPCKAYVPGS